MILLFTLVAALQAQPAFEPQSSGTDASLRGIAVVSARVAWAAGTKGTVLRTVDGGQHWERRAVPGAEALDFRDVHAFNERIAVIMSAGPGDKSRIYRTGDGGATWQLVLTNESKEGFWDSIAFWDDRRGLLMGDPVDGRFELRVTADGGKTWTKLTGPEANAGEGAFAASGTCVVMGRPNEAWIATGGTGGARVFHTTDGGRAWLVASAPVRHDEASAGIFSIAFRGKLGIAVGGHYQKPTEDANTGAITHDGGTTWRPVNVGGYRSGVAIGNGDTLVAVGSDGVSYSEDGGQTWKALGNTGYHAIALTRDGVGWAVGAEGRISRVRR